MNQKLNCHFAAQENEGKMVAAQVSPRFGIVETAMNWNNIAFPSFEALSRRYGSEACFRRQERGVRSDLSSYVFCSSFLNVLGTGSVRIGSEVSEENRGATGMRAVTGQNAHDRRGGLE